MDHIPPTDPQRTREELERVQGRLARLMEPVQVQRWLKQPNPAFDGLTPVQVVERGEMDRIWRVLHDLESGQPG